MAKLILTTAKGVKLVRLDGANLTLGRSAQCDVALDRPSISRMHAVLSSTDGLFSICDLDSSNGTFVNGAKVHRQALRHQDVIRIGECEMRFFDPPPSAVSTDLLSLVA